MAYVELDVAMAGEAGAAAWAFDLDAWGVCGQGATEAEALAALLEATGADSLVVAERIVGDEQAFQADHTPVTAEHRRRTETILRTARAETVALIVGASAAERAWADPGRQLPSWARWHTLEQMAWHVADTESRYYLPSLGLGYRPACAGLVEELHTSLDHVVRIVQCMPSALARRSDGGAWTSMKVLRRLAWHERSELVVMRRLAHSAREALTSRP